MSEKDINRWHNTITPYDKAPQPWTLGSGGSWDMLEVQPIPDAMLAELAQRYHYAGTPWNCRSMPLSDGDREYMYLLYSSMQGLVARMRQAERQAADFAAAVRHACSEAMAEPKMLIPLPDDMARLMKLAQWQAGEIERLRERVFELQADPKSGDLHAKATELHEHILAEVYRLHAEAGEVHRLRESEKALVATLRDEMDEGLRLRELGGARPDEGITAMTERIVAENAQLRAELERLSAAAESEKHAHTDWVDDDVRVRHPRA